MIFTWGQSSANRFSLRKKLQAESTKDLLPTLLPLLRRPTTTAGAGGSEENRVLYRNNCIEKVQTNSYIQLPEGLLPPDQSLSSLPKSLSSLPLMPFQPLKYLWR
jgi:hypothetical protein